MLRLGKTASGVGLASSVRLVALPDVVVTNLHRRYTGVSATVRVLVPHQRQQITLAVWDWGGLGLGGELDWRSLLRWGWKSPQVGRWRIWHARRDLEILIGLVLRSLLRQPWRVIFTSAAPKPPGWWLRQLIRHCDAVIATSPRSAQFLERCNAVIFHGVDCEEFHPLPDRQTALAEVGLEGMHCIGCFGRIRFSKGTDLVVESLIQLLPMHLNWVGVITGLCQPRDQPFLDTLLQRVADVGLEGRIRFVGDLQPGEIRRWYQRTSICVAASRREGFGLTPLEAMASGCVPVTSQEGAWPWIISPDVGVTVETGKLMPMVSALDALMSDDQRLSALAKHARRVVVQNYSVELEASQINRFYEKLQCR